VHSHRMIGFFRMIILLTGQIILRTRMIGRDGQKKKRQFVRNFRLLGRRDFCHPAIILNWDAADWSNLSPRSTFCHPTIILQYSAAVILRIPTQSSILHNNIRCSVLSDRMEAIFVVVFVLSLLSGMSPQEPGDSACGVN
jgi:hypothetical protein